MSTAPEQIARLEAAIAAQEGLRPVLGDQAVDAIIAAARAQLAALRAVPLDSDAAETAARLLARQLDMLLAAGLIRQAARAPELEYLFRHSLLQEATYGSMLHAQRQAFHQQIGRVMEQLFAAELAPRAATLALHFDAAGDTARALKYFTLAGDHAFQQFANAEAIGHYGRALALARRSAAPSQQLIHLGVNLGRAYELTNDYPGALAVYVHMQQLAGSPDASSGTPGAPGGVDLALRLSGQLAEAIAYGTPSNVHDPSRAIELSRAALALARRLGDPAAEAKALWNLMQVGFWTGTGAQQALADGEESLAIARRYDLREQMGFTLINMAGVYWGLGRFSEAQALIEDAREIWRGLNNLSMLGDAYNMGAWTQLFDGHFDACHAEAGSGLEISRKLDNHWNLAGGLQVKGNAYYHQGLFGQAREALLGAVEHCRLAHISAADTLSCLADTYAALGARTQARAASEQSLAELSTLAANFHGWTVGTLARAHLTLGDVADAAEVMQAAGLNLAATEQFWFESPYRMAQAALCTAQARPAEALRSLEALIPFLKESSLGVYLYDALFVQAQALLAAGKWTRAARALDEARAEAEARGARRMLWQVYGAQASVAQAQGAAVEAAHFRQLARAEIEHIAANAGTEELRASFLARPDIRSLLAPGDQAGTDL